MNTELSEVVLRRCDQDQLPADHVLRILAHNFDVASCAVIKEPTLDTSKKMLGAWARLRKEWSAYSGEPIL
jgi:hypothetical protein